MINSVFSDGFKVICKNVLTAAALSIALSVSAAASILPQDHSWNQGGMVKWQSDLFFFTLDYPVWMSTLEQRRSEMERELTQVTNDLEQLVPTAPEAERKTLEADSARIRQAVLLYRAEQAKTDRDKQLLNERPDRTFLEPLIYEDPQFIPETQQLLAEEYTMPAIGKETSPFGWRIHPVTGLRSLHEGLDLANAEGTPIMAAKSGIVTFAGFNDISGNNILIRHFDGQETSYYHMIRLKAKRGEFVQQGEVIGLMGTTGRSTGNHLHFEIRINGMKVDAAPYIYKGSRREIR